MTDVAAEPADRKSPSKLWSALRGTGRTAADTYRMGARTALVAPGLLALIVLPEFAQHVAEIRLGMFESREAFRSLANDSTRWAFGYVKVAGFVIAILAVARFWALGSVRRALLIRPGNLLRLAIAIGLTILAELSFNWLKEMSGSSLLDGLLTAVSTLIQAGLLVYLVSALLDERDVSLRTAFTERYPTALFLLVIAALAFIPAQVLHSVNHLLALGRPDAIVWALMVFDSLVVGLMAALVGTALYLANRAAPTWRGWTVPPTSSPTPPA